VFSVVKFTAVEPLLQTTRSGGRFTCPEGFTVIVNVCGVPVQFTVPAVKVGVTVRLATTGIFPVLTAENNGIFPVPEAARPMAGWSFVQRKIVDPPVLGEMKETEAEPVLQITRSDGSFTFPDGRTVMANVSGVPSQLMVPAVKVGVTVMMAVTGLSPALVAVNGETFPVPAAASPMEGLSLVQA
jgi:hypothetical protein